MEWWAVLGLSGFLSGEKSTVITNIYIKKLSNDLVDFTNSISDKWNEYFKKTMNAPLENIAYRNFSVQLDHLLENVLHKSDSTNNEEETD